MIPLTNPITRSPLRVNLKRYFTMDDQTLVETLADLESRKHENNLRDGGVYARQARIGAIRTELARRAHENPDIHPVAVAFVQEARP